MRVQALFLAALAVVLQGTALAQTDVDKKVDAMEQTVAPGVKGALSDPTKLTKDAGTEQAIKANFDAFASYCQSYVAWKTIFSNRPDDATKAEIKVLVERMGKRQEDLSKVGVAAQKLNEVAEKLPKDLNEPLLDSLRTQASGKKSGEKPSAMEQIILKGVQQEVDRAQGKGSFDNWQCTRCNTVIQSKFRPSDYNCPSGKGMHHSWNNLGPVGR